MYWLCALPLGDDSPDHVWNRLQELTTYTNDYSVNFKFNLTENLRVGTLDSLLALSDDLIKVNSAVEGTVNKIRRQLYELQSQMPEDERSEVWVEGLTPESYLQRFVWNEAKYPSRRPPKDTVHAILETMQKIDDDLKSRGTEYSQSRTSLQTILRKQTGSLAVRDLSGIITKNQLVNTENLTTLVVVVPKASRNEWTSNYESLTDFVVPRSSILVAEDAEYLAFAVVLFRRVADDFKAAARSKGFQAKEVLSAALDGDSSSNGNSSSGDGSIGLSKLKQEVETKRNALVQWCLASYGEAFSSWVHVTAIRLFAESILRYGLPPQFLPVLMKPNPKYQSQLRKVLSTYFGAVGGHHYTSEAGSGEGDLFPYVSFTLNIEEHS